MHSHAKPIQSYRQAKLDDFAFYVGAEGNDVKDCGRIQFFLAAIGSHGYRGL